MIKFLLFILFFGFLLVFLLGFSIIRSVKNVLFGSSDKSHASRRSNSNRSSGQQHNHQSANEEYTRPSSRKKIFAKDEGEYVDYEEVK